MNRILKAAIILLFLLPFFAEAKTHAKSKLPNEVKKFIDRRENCEHFRGEEGSSQKRKKEIEAGWKKYCKGSDNELKKLRKKYLKKANVIRALRSYEDHIE